MRFIFGEDPYNHDSNYALTANTLDEALSKLAMKGLPVHDCVGRGDIFVPGLHLPRPSYEVVGVWADDQAYARSHWGAGVKEIERGNKHHTGRGSDYWMCQEIGAERLLLQMGSNSKQITAGESETSTAVMSPMGRSFNDAGNLRQAIVRMEYKLEQQIAKYTEKLDAAKERMQTEMVDIVRKQTTFEYYLHGKTGWVQLKEGARSNQDYYVLYSDWMALQDEVGYIACLKRVSLGNVGALFKWLSAYDRVYQLLPAEKCIALTRPSFEDTEISDYADIFQAINDNQFKKRAIIWVRDGANVWYCTLEPEALENLHFPDPRLAVQNSELVLQAYWKEHHGPRYRSSFTKEDTKVSDQCRPLGSNNPDEHYETYEEWTAKYCSNELRQLVSKFINELALKLNEDAWMLSCLLQGTVDAQTKVLDIPQGTDIFTDDFHKYVHIVTEKLSLNDPAYERIRHYADLTTFEPGDWIVCKELHDMTRRKKRGYDERYEEYRALESRSCWIGKLSRNGEFRFRRVKETDYYRRGRHNWQATVYERQVRTYTLIQGECCKVPVHPDHWTLMMKSRQFKKAVPWFFTILHNVSTFEQDVFNVVKGDKDGIGRYFSFRED